MASLSGVDAPIAAYNQDASDLAIVTGDGRVKIFSAAQQRLRADITQALTGSKGLQASTSIYSCLDWNKETTSADILYLGTTSGEIKAFDVSRSELKWAVFAAVDGAIASVAAATSGSRLVVAGKNGTSSIVDTASGASIHRWRASKHELSAAALLPDGRALLAGSGISLFEPSTGERLGKWTGHATSVNAIAVSRDAKYFATAAVGERQVAVWSLEMTQTGKLKHKSAVARLNLEQPAKSITISSESSPNNFNIAIVTVSGALRVFDCTSSDGSLECVEWAASDSQNSNIIQATARSADANGMTVAVASGSVVKPQFESLHIQRSASGGVALIQLAETEAGKLLGSTSQKQSSAKKSGTAAHEPSSILGASEGIVMASKLAGSTGKRSRDADEEAEAMELNEEVDEDAQKEQEAEELTFAERLAALQQVQQDGHKETDTKTTKGKKGAAANKVAAVLDSGPVKADSLAVLLTQALQSGDKVLLERCLIVRKEEIIKNTVKRLAPTDAAEFLRAMVLRLQSSPARGEQLATWIRAVLLYHTGYLSGIGGMSGTLGYLYQIIEGRLASYQPLLALNGRLDVVLANARMAQEGGAAGFATGPLVNVEVGSDGGIEVEDAFAAANLSEDESEDYTDDEDDDIADLANGMDSDEGDDDDDDE